MAFHSALLHFISLARARFPSLGSFKQIHCFTLPSRPVSEVCSWLAPRLFRETSRSAFPEFFQLVCLVVLWPFRSFRLSPAFFTTTASADFCRALARQISPSKVSTVSTRVVGLYLLRLSVTVGFSI